MNFVNTQQPLPTGYTPDQQRGAFNNSMAMAHAQGDPRYALKKGGYDRPGLSRAGAQKSAAEADAAGLLASGVAEAYAGQLDDAQYGANTALQGLVDQEQFVQQAGALQAQNAYANQMAALQQQQMGLNLLGSLLG